MPEGPSLFLATVLGKQPNEDFEEIANKVVSSQIERGQKLEFIFGPLILFETLFWKCFYSP
jgi:hypothetical protein